MIWLLDTNVVIHAIRNNPASVRLRLTALGPDDVCVSAITIAELCSGAQKAQNSVRRRAVFEAFLAPYEVLSFDRGAAVRHAELRHTLRHSPIGERDLFIAAIALDAHLGVVTNNTREFRRIPGLRVEDWTRAE